MSDWKNRLYFGDNLDILRKHVADESVDLIYLDPPFNSNATYNVLFSEKGGDRSAAQITAFDDTWHWGLESEEAYHQLVTGGGGLADVVSAFRLFLGPNDMMAYLVMMAARLKELHRVLKGEGSIYLHCDPTASHYLKILMDTVFGPANFRNEIVWKRVTAHSDARRWSPVADVIFYYGKSDRVCWNPQHVSHKDAYVKSKYRHVDEDGRRYRLDNMTSPNPRPNMMYEWNGHSSPSKGWRYSKETMTRLDSEGRIWYPDDRSKRPQLKRYLDESEGQVVGSVWTDIHPINSQAQERLGYPTQKPEALLERIVRASSNEGDIVLDPFCGCGTAVAVAERLNRRWIGIDITHLAITLIRHRLMSAFDKQLSAYEVVGAPTDVEGARALALQNRHQFELWALGLVGAQPADDRKRGADRGIDGVIRFIDDRSGKPKRLVVQVKSGKVQASQVRDLVGTMEREKAAIGAFVTLEPPTRPMVVEAATAGFYEPEHFKGQRYPRLQVFTIEELLAGQELQYPRLAPADTFKRAGRASKRPVEEAGDLF